MHEQYKAWIEQYLKSNPVVGNCKEACEEMLASFTDLTLVRGHVHIYQGDRRSWPHWWLIDPEENIIDPTRSQFPGDVVYEAWNESEEEPTGKCPNCGGYCYSGDYFCSRSCGNEYTAYINASLR